MYNTIAFPHPKNLCNIFLLKQIVPGFQSEASAKYNFCAQHLRLHAPAFCNTFIVRVRPCVTAKLPVLKPRFWNFMLIKNCARFLLLYCLLCWQSRQSSLQAPFFGRCYDPEPRCMEMWKCICELPFVLPSSFK